MVMVSRGVKVSSGRSPQMEASIFMTARMMFTLPLQVHSRCISGMHDLRMSGSAQMTAGGPCKEGDPTT